MAKLFEFKNVLSGDKGNLASISDWKDNILGVMFIFIVISLGQALTRKATSILPVLDGQIEPIITQPVQSSGLVKYTM